MSSMRSLVSLATAAGMIISGTASAAAKPVRPSGSKLSMAAAVQGSQAQRPAATRARATPPGFAATPVLLGLGLVFVLAVAVGLGGQGGRGASPD